MPGIRHTTYPYKDKLISKVGDNSTLLLTDNSTDQTLTGDLGELNLVDGNSVTVQVSEVRTHLDSSSNPHSTTLDLAFDAGKIIDGANSLANTVRIGNGTEYFGLAAYDLGLGLGTTANFVPNCDFACFVGNVGDGTATMYIGTNNLTGGSIPFLNLVGWGAGGPGGGATQLSFAVQHAGGHAQVWGVGLPELRFYLNDLNDYIKMTTTSNQASLDWVGCPGKITSDQGSISFENNSIMEVVFKGTTGSVNSPISSLVFYENNYENTNIAKIDVERGGSADVGSFHWYVNDGTSLNEEMILNKNGLGINLTNDGSANLMVLNNLSVTDDGDCSLIMRSISDEPHLVGTVGSGGTDMEIQSSSYMRFRAGNRFSFGHSSDSNSVLMVTGGGATRSGYIRAVYGNNVYFGSVYTQMYHDGTDGYIEVSSGDLFLDPAGANVKIPDGSRLNILDSTNADYIEIFHDGTDANVYVNTGSLDLRYLGKGDVTCFRDETDANQRYFKVFAPNSAQCVSFFHDGTDAKLVTDDSAASDLIIDCGTEKTIELAEPCWRDINLSSQALSLLGILVGPGTDELKDSTGTDTDVDVYAFDVGEGVSGCFEMQHDYKEGSDVTFHVHWQGIAAPTGTDKVKWQLKYTISRNSQTLQAPTTITAESDFDTQYEVVRTDFAAITGSTAGHGGGNIQIGDQFCFQLSRVAASSDEYGGDALLITAGLHIQLDTMGSRQINTK